MQHLLLPPAARVLGFLAGVCFLQSATAQPVVQTVFYDMPGHLLPDPVPAPTATLLAVAGYPDDPERMTFIARLYLPDPAVHGPGPHPTVLFLHGSGGVWANSSSIPSPLTANNSPAQQFRDWGNLLVDLGYACLFPDSLHPRGISGSFEGRRPHHDPLEDDALCSPNYERPKDVIAALEYLVTRPEIDRDRIALIGFSHGAQTGMNVLLDASVDLGNYEVDCIDLVPHPDDPDEFVEQTVKKAVPPPVRIPSHLPIPKFCAFYYGGGGHFSYHGSPNSTAAGRYMLDRRTTAILFHGTGDSLMGITNHASTPVAGSLFPVKQVLASAAQAAALGVPNPIVRHRIFNRTAVHAANQRVAHSFDLGSVGWAPAEEWDTADEFPNRKARRLARDEVLRWLDFKLGPSPSLTLDFPDNFTVEATWPTRTRLSYLLQAGETPGSWNDATAWTDGSGDPGSHEESAPPSGRYFFRLVYRPTPMPVDAPEHAGFYMDYSAFGF